MRLYACRYIDPWNYSGTSTHTVFFAAPDMLGAEREWRRRMGGLGYKLQTIAEFDDNYAEFCSPLSAWLTEMSKREP